MSKNLGKDIVPSSSKIVVFKLFSWCQVSGVRFQFFWRTTLTPETLKF